jgi:hypothetical protein
MKALLSLIIASALPCVALGSVVFPSDSKGVTKVARDIVALGAPVDEAVSVLSSHGVRCYPKVDSNGVPIVVCRTSAEVGDQGYQWIFVYEARDGQISKLPLKAIPLGGSLENQAEMKAAEPGATDNPGDAQRFREDH